MFPHDRAVSHQKTTVRNASFSHPSEKTLILSSCARYRSQVEFRVGAVAPVRPVAEKKWLKPTGPLPLADVGFYDIRTPSDGGCGSPTHFEGCHMYYMKVIAEYPTDVVYWEMFNLTCIIEPSATGRAVAIPLVIFKSLVNQTRVSGSSMICWFPMTSRRRVTGWCSTLRPTVRGATCTTRRHRNGSSPRKIPCECWIGPFGQNISERCSYKKTPTPVLFLSVAIPFRVRITSTFHSFLPITTFLQFSSSGALSVSRFS